MYAKNLHTSTERRGGISKSNRNILGFQSHRDVRVKILSEQVRGRGQHRVDNEHHSSRRSEASQRRNCSLIFAAFYTRGSSSKWSPRAVGARFVVFNIWWHAPKSVQSTLLLQKLNRAVEQMPTCYVLTWSAAVESPSICSALPATSRDRDSLGG